MVDLGADAVVCSHTHCPLPWEMYADRPIVYGLGNLIFEGTGKESDTWYEGYLARLTINDRQIGFEAIPYFQSRERIGAQKMKENARKLFISDMEGKRDQLQDVVFLEDHWARYCRQQRDTYLSFLFGYNRPMRKLQRLLFPLLHSKEAVRQALLLVQCESNQEIINTILRDERRRE